MIPRSVRLSEAPSFGKPIATYDKESIGAEKYEELTREIFGLSPAKVELDSLAPDIEPMQMAGEN